MTSTITVGYGVIYRITSGTTINCNLNIEYGGLFKASTDAGTITIVGNVHNEGTLGHTGHTGTISITGTVTGCGDYLGGFSGYEPATCGVFSYVTDDGLHITSHRLISNLFTGHPAYAGKLDRIRLYFRSTTESTTYDSYIDCPVAASISDNNFMMIPKNYNSSTDLQYNTSYDSLRILVRGIIPEAKYIYNAGENEFAFYTSNMEIYMAELINESDVIFATTNLASSALFTVNASTRYTIDWNIDIGNDLVPPEWSGMQRSAVTQNGLSVIGRRLIFDDNLSPQVSPPFGIYLNEYANGCAMNDGTWAYVYYSDNGSDWYAPSAGQSMTLNREFVIGSPYKFHAMYFDIVAGVDPGIYTLSYYDSEEADWIEFSTYGDGTDQMTQDGYMEFFMPDFWGLTTVNSVSAYWVKLEVTSAYTTHPQLNPSTSKVYIARVDTTEYLPSDMTSVKGAALIHAFESKPSVILSTDFTATEVGRPISSDDLLVSANSVVVNGISLTNYNPIGYIRQDPIYVVIDVSESYYGVNANGYVYFSKTAYPLKPHTVLCAIRTDTGEMLTMDPSKMQIVEDANSYYIYGFTSGTETSADVYLWYLPSEIDISDISIGRVLLMQGPSDNLSSPSLVRSGIVNGDWIWRTPEEIASYIRDGQYSSWGQSFEKKTTMKSGVNTKAFMKSHAPGSVAFSGANSSPRDTLAPDNLAVLGMWYAKTRSYYTGAAISKVSGNKNTVEKWKWNEHSTLYKSNDNLNQSPSYMIKNTNNNFLFSLTGTGNWPCVLFTFPNPEAADKFVLQYQYNAYNKLGVFGYDIYVHNGDTWINIGGSNIHGGREFGDVESVEIDANLIPDDSMVHILLVSKVPQYSFAHGITVLSDVPEDVFKYTYNEIAEKYKTESDLAGRQLSHRYVPDNTFTFDSVFARLIGIGTNSDGTLTEYREGSEFYVDSANSKIVLWDDAEYETATSSYPSGTAIKKTLTMPMIGFQTDVFVNIGMAVAYEDSGTWYDRGKWHDGTAIETDWTDEDFNFEFALSKVPYISKHLLHASSECEWQEYFNENEIKIYYKDDYQYSDAEAHADNRILRRKDGGGCWVAEIRANSNPNFGKITQTMSQWNTGLIGIVSITYPYLIDNYFEVAYMEDVDFGLFSKSYREHNTFSTPVSISNIDTLVPQIQIDVRWPRGKEPATLLEEG